MTTARPVARTLVDAGDVRLSTRVSGPADAPVVVAVHGFPDTQDVWDLVVDRLADDHRVVTFDVRGAGGSSAPSSSAGYAVPRLVEDHVAVIRSAVPDGRPVHLLGHDWGSVQLWETVLRADGDPRLRGRIASFTSISGPPLAHYARHLRGTLRRRELRRFAAQARRSWYVAAFQVPVLPELVLRRFAPTVRRAITRADRLGDAAHWAPTFAEDAAHGVNLYRANVRAPVSGDAASSSDVPVRLLVPRHDPFLSPDLYTGIERTAPHVLREDVDGGHWLPRSAPDLVAERVRDQVARTS